MDETKKARSCGPFGWFGSMVSVDHERDVEETIGSSSFHEVGACGPAADLQGEAVLTHGELSVVENGHLSTPRIKHGNSHLPLDDNIEVHPRHILSGDW